MIKLWKFFPVLIVLAVCLGLMLVPAAMGVSAQPASGKVGMTLPAEVTVAKGETFEVNVTLYNPHGANMSVATAAVRSDNANLLTVNSLAQVDWPAQLGQWIGVGEFTYDGGGNVGTPYLNTTIVHCTVNFTANATTGGVTIVKFVHDGGEWDDTDCAVKDNSAIPLDLLDWGAVQNMTVIIGDVFNLTVTSTGCCPITVGTMGTVGPGNSTLFTVPCPNVTLTADDSDVCCNFVNWTVNGTFRPGKSIVVNGTANSSHTAVATCSMLQYNLTMNVTGNGNTTPAIGVHTYNCSDVVVVNATADPWWRFVNWTGDLTGSVKPNTITMDGDKNVTANFVERFNLTMNVTGNGTTSPSIGNHTYDNGDVVPISATPSACWDFVNWTGDVAAPNSASTNVTVDANKTVTANFAQVNYTLNINVTGSGNVTINGTTPTSYPNSTSWVNCTVVPLTATPDENYTFVNWTGDLTGSTNPTNITIDGDKTVTANFALKWYNLTINSTTGGTVTDPGEDVYSYEHGTVQNLIAEADADYAFLEWSGDVSEIDDVNSTNTNITMYGNYSIMALFGPHDFDTTPRSLTFTTVEGENPPSQTLEICNTGNGTLDWSVSDNKGWLKESPTSGSLAEEGCEDVKVSVDVAGMKAGDYRATITFTGSLDLEVPVRLHIESAMEAMPVLPAGLSASALSISPQQVQPDQDVTISVNVANTGGKTGSYNAVLYINSVVEDSQTVSVAAGASKNVIFTVSKSAAGVYDVSLAGQSGQFEVVGGGGWFGGGGLGTGGIIAIVVVVIILIVAVIFILRGTARPE